MNNKIRRNEIYLANLGHTVEVKKEEQDQF